MSLEATAKLVAIIPQFLVTDLKAACAFYRDRLGFVVSFIHQDFYAGVTRDGVMIHLKLSDVPAPDRTFIKENEHLDVYIKVENVAELYREFRASGAPIIRPLESTAWGTSEFVVEDLAGYILYFGE